MKRFMAHLQKTSTKVVLIAEESRSPVGQARDGNSVINLHFKFHQLIFVVLNMPFP